ncbi:MAG: 50S ribosomal protein L13 [bacterium]|nr:50S ribosomal protein L13 [bacterium]
MNRTFFLAKEARSPKWHLIDAENQVLGRLATKLADMLRGKDKPYYTPHTDCGDYVVVINADKIVLTGDKWKGKTYDRYSGWRGGYKVETAEELLAKFPTRLIEYAVRGMMPKNKLNNQIFKKLKVYAGTTHPHTAQIETAE